MIKSSNRALRRWLLAAITCGLSMVVTDAFAQINGVTGNQFNLVADQMHLTTPDGDSILVWGYGLEGRPVQYPGPTLIVNEGDQVKVTLRNRLSEDVSIVFPGQENVTSSGGTVDGGLIAAEAPPGGQTKVSYTFQATHPGTYAYHSGSHMDLQLEMGLFGAIIVRPAGHPDQAYQDSISKFDHEYLFILSEMDPKIHDQMDFGMADKVDTTGYASVLWYVNGRNGPDTLYPDSVPWMPHQPYGALARSHPGETVLSRFIDMGRMDHPWHTHGNNFHIIARDGRELSSNGTDIDLREEDYTLLVSPGTTYDTLWTWSGKDMNWDFFGHDCSGPTPPPLVSYQVHGTYGATTVTTDGVAKYEEDLNLHCKPFPVVNPDNLDVTFGGFYAGSPFLGGLATLPVGEGGLNVNGGMFFIWHSHRERELVNNNIFPGGMLTMMVVEPPGVPIP